MDTLIHEEELCQGDVDAKEGFLEEEEEDWINDFGYDY